MCDLCGKTLSSKKDLHYHVSQKHDYYYAKHYFCELCRKQFRNAEQKIQHILRVEVCEHCQKEFCDPCDLENHYVKNHDKIPNSITLIEDYETLFENEVSPR